MNKKMQAIFFIAILELLGIFIPLCLLHAEDIQKRRETLLFQSTGTLHSGAQRMYQGLYKGLSVSFSAQENIRYAAVITSQSLDSVLQLKVNSKKIFRDIFLGEDAGIIFTPVFSLQSQDEQNAQKHVQNYEETSKVTITAFFHPPKKEKNSSIENVLTELGEYSVSVYEITPKHTISSFPFEKNIATLTHEDSIVGKIAQEYAMRVRKNTRLYAFMDSRDFDTLLEFSNTYGEVVASDDWIKNDHISTSLLSLVIPEDGMYFIMPTSFSGRAEGVFSLRVFTTENENVFSESATLSEKDIKIFKRYIREYPLALQAEDAMTVSISALSGSVEVIFSRADRSALHSQKVTSGITKDIPIFTTEAGDYKIIVASDSNLPIHYSIALYK